MLTKSCYGRDGWGVAGEGRRRHRVIRGQRREGGAASNHSQLSMTGRSMEVQERWCRGDGDVVRVAMEEW